MYLSILPAHGLQPLDLHPKVSAESSDAQTSFQGASSRQRGHSFSSPLLSRRTGAASHHQVQAQTYTSAGLGIHLADDDVLLPFIDRPAEVRELLQHGQSGTIICQKLEAVHRNHPMNNYETEWHYLQELLFETDRTQLSDRSWLQALKSCIFPRVPHLWCQLSECLGAREICLDQEPPTPCSWDSFDRRVSWNTDSEVEDAVTPTELAQFEVLNALPTTFKERPYEVRGVSVHEEADVPTTLPGRRLSTIVSSQEEQEAKKVLAEHDHTFAGIRIRMATTSPTTSAPPTPASPALDRGLHNALGLSHDATAPTLTSRQRAHTVGHGPSFVEFTRQRRLGELLGGPKQGADSPWAYPTARRGTESDVLPPSSSPLSPRRHLRRRLHSDSVQQTGGQTTSGLDLPVSKNSDEDVGALPPPWEHIRPTSVRRRSSDKRLSISSAPPLTQAAGEPSSPKKANLHGLMRDGRTRHPSAGAHDGRPNLAAFKQTLALSTSDSEGGSNDVSAATSTAGDAVEEVMLAPKQGHRATRRTASEPAVLQVTSTSAPRRSSEPTHTRPSLRLGSDSNKNYDIHVKPPLPSPLVFPIQPNPFVSRPLEMLQRLDQACRSTDEESEPKRTIRLLRDIIGSRGLDHIRMVVQCSGERWETSDETLLRRLAAKCFGLVDMDKAMQDNNHCHREAEHDVAARHKAEEVLRRRPWHVQQQRRRKQKQQQTGRDATGHSSGHHSGLSTPTLEVVMEEDEESAQVVNKTHDHEARLSALFDDVEGYTERWEAFEALLTRIWGVDEETMAAIRQKCGPITTVSL